MTENKQAEKEIKPDVVAQKDKAPAKDGAVQGDGSSAPATENRSDYRRGRPGGDRRRSGGRPRFQRERSEFDQRIIGIRRVTRVVSGGRRFSFSVAIVIGDRKGRVGVGLGKSTDTSLAIEKAVRDAKKELIKINLTEDNSIPHELSAKYKASVVEIRPAPGRGLVAGSSVRDVLDLAGVKNVSTKLLSRSKNKINNARCAIEALRPISKSVPTK